MSRQRTVTAQPTPTRVHRWISRSSNDSHPQSRSDRWSHPTCGSWASPSTTKARSSAPVVASTATGQSANAPATASATTRTSDPDDGPDRPRDGDGRRRDAGRGHACVVRIRQVRRHRPSAQRARDRRAARHDPGRLHRRPDGCRRVPCAASGAVRRGSQITTFGPYSPGQAVVMKRMGIEAIYLGGWATSAKGSPSEDPGPDLASYPLSQVPDEAAGLVRALLTADRNQHFARAQMDEGSGGRHRPSTSARSSSPTPTPATAVTRTFGT